MKYYFVISPSSLAKSLISESKRLMKIVYAKDVRNIFYRVKTKKILDNPRRIFIRGNGIVLKAEVKPHIALIHNISLPDSEKENFINEATDICKNYKVLNLEFAGTGNYGMDFTFFVRFKSNPQIGKLRSDLLGLSKPYMSEDEYKQQIAVDFIPHATVLYDDRDPVKVITAYNLLDKNKFSNPVEVKEILLWGVSPTRQKVIKRLSLAEN